MVAVVVVVAAAAGTEVVVVVVGAVAAHPILVCSCLVLVLPSNPCSNEMRFTLRMR